MFECYSERGLLSYMMFHLLWQSRQLGQLLQAIQFEPSVRNPFTTDKITRLTFFSELHLGTRGFGVPDGAIYFALDDVPHLIMIEAKANDDYRYTTIGKEYGKQTRGQLERHYRAVWLYKNGHI